MPQLAELALPHSYFSVLGNATCNSHSYTCIPEPSLDTAEKRLCPPMHGGKLRPEYSLPQPAGLCLPVGRCQGVPCLGNKGDQTGPDVVTTMP